MTVQSLNSYWKPVRNGVTVEDNIKHKDCLEHLAYHDGLNPSIWKRSKAPVKNIHLDSSTDSLYYDNRKQLSNNGDLSNQLNCLWETDSICDETSTFSQVDSWLKLIQTSTSNLTTRTDSHTPRATHQDAKNVSHALKEPKVEELKPEEKKQEEVQLVMPYKIGNSIKQQLPLCSTKQLLLADRPDSWLLLVIFLGLIFIQRLFLIPEVATCSKK